MSTKRKRAFLSIKDKQIIISRLDKGEKGTNLAQEFGISKQQISDIRKNKDKILKFTDSIETSEGLKRKSLKLADDEQLDKALYAWFIQQRSTGTPISGLLLQEKAKHFSTQLNTEMADREFKASTGWLEKFKTPHGIRNLNIQGEKLSAAEETSMTKEAAQCFKKCLSWMESQNDIDPVQLMQLRRMMRTSYKSLNQTNMLEHFRPF